MKLKIPFHMNAPQKIVSTEMLLDSKIRWGAPSIHFEEPLKKTSLVSASREKGGGERGNGDVCGECKGGTWEGEQQPNALKTGFKGESQVSPPVSCLMWSGTGENRCGH